MRIHSTRPGFSLAEILIVALIGGVTLAAVYQTLITQEKSYRAGGAIIAGQETLRTALGVLESELREVSTIDGDGSAGGSDIAVAGTDSITFRAHRKIGVVCTMSKNERWLLAWVHGDLFASGDSIMLFVDSDSLRYQDDAWGKAEVTGASTTTSAACTDKWTTLPLQKINIGGTLEVLGIGGMDLSNVRVGAPLRSFEWVTYGLYDFGDLGWGLGRRRAEDADPSYLVGNLADREHGGLLFTYYDSDNVVTTDPGAIARIEIQVRTEPPQAEGVESAVMTSNLFLRNN